MYGCIRHGMEISFVTCYGNHALTVCFSLYKLSLFWYFPNYFSFQVEVHMV